MDDLLENLGVVNTDESGELRRVQELVEEAQAASAAAQGQAPNTGVNSSANSNQRTKRSVLEQIMEGANAANDPQLTGAGKHTQQKGYHKEERVKFLDKLEDIPNSHERESGYISGKRGYYNPTAALNLFSKAQSDSYEYRTSTNVDTSALVDIMNDAKRQRTTQTTGSSQSAMEEVAAEVYAPPLETAHPPNEAVVSSTDTIGGMDAAAVPIEDIVCPFCSRNLQHLATGRNAAMLVEQHIERCSRRGGRSATVAGGYAEDSEEEERTETAQRSGRSGRRGNSGVGRGASSSSARRARVPAAAPEEAVEDGVLEEGEQEGEGSEWEDPDAGADTRRRGQSSNEIAEGVVPLRTTRATRAAAGRQKAGSARAVTAPTDSDEVGSSTSTDWDSFVPSIVDDWEDDAYLNRLEQLQEDREAQLRKKNKASRRPTGRQSVTAVNDVAPAATGNDSDEDSEFVRADYGVEVLRRTWASLHEYQREGCRWLHRLYDEGVGGILGDEMGLGKTAQMCTHLGSLARLQMEENARSRAEGRPTNSAIFIVVCPATVLHHWLQEFHRWSPFMRAVVLHSISATASELLKVGNEGIPKVLRKLRRKESTQGLVVITTYEGLRKYRLALVSIEWTAVCLDEGQKIRNPAAEITNTCKMLPAFHRVILSGTPIQNSLRELWSLFDFIYPGRLGSLPVFEQEFATPIRTGGYANANVLQYEIAIRCASTLQKIVKPYLLRRKKDDLITVTKLPPKTEQVLFCQISPRQREIYLNIIESPEVKAVLQRRMMAFRAINTLRKLCNHPALVFQQGKIVWQQDPLQEVRNTAPGGVVAAEEGELGEGDDNDAAEAALLNKIGSGGVVWADSGKLLVLSKLLPLWYAEGHKVLIFTQTRGMLGIIESMVRELGFLYLRLDGSTPVGKRAGMVNEYNTNPKIFVMLLTTRTGGVGISLTAANRVVLYDPDWNPMTDMQSRERAWRLGQKRAVTVYRLITRGTIEEKIYQRQIFKLLLSNRILENSKQKALFAESHIRELFELNDSYSKAGQDRFGHSTVNEALPAGGEVSLHKPAVGSSSSGTTTRAGGAAEPNDGDNHGDGNATEAAATGVAGMNVEVADFVQENNALPPELVEEIERNEEPAADGSNSRDRRLLQALFAGDAITSVYDHHFFDPTNNRPETAGAVDPKAAAAQLRKAAERVAVRTEASNAVHRALTELQSSARVYQGPVPRVEEAAACLPTPPATYEYGTQSIDDTDYVLTGSAGGPRPRFGGSSSSLFGTSSASLLAGLAQDNPPPIRPSASSGSLGSANGSRSGTSGTGRSPGPAGSDGIAASGPSSMMSRALSSGTRGAARELPAVRPVAQAVAAPPLTALPTSSSSSFSSAALRGGSVKEDIAARLNTLFRETDRPLTTAFVLSRFKDLGDQYAPLFRDLLRTVATHKNGTWTRK